MVMQAVSEQEARQKALMDKDVMAQRRRAHNLTVLPQLYDSLRALYGLTGPSTRPLPQASLSSTCALLAALQMQMIGMTHHHQINQMASCLHAGAWRCHGRNGVGSRGMPAAILAPKLALRNYANRASCMWLQVVQSLAGSRGSSQAPEDIKAQLQELAALCPNFLSIDQAREGPGSIVRVNRKAAAKAVRQTLVKAASERHAIFQLQL